MFQKWQFQQEVDILLSQLAFNFLQNPFEVFFVESRKIAITNAMHRSLPGNVLSQSDLTECASWGEFFDLNKPLKLRVRI